MLEIGSIESNKPAPERTFMTEARRVRSIEKNDPLREVIQTGSAQGVHQKAQKQPG